MTGDGRGMAFLFGLCGAGGFVGMGTIHRWIAAVVLLVLFTLIAATFLIPWGHWRINR